MQHSINLQEQIEQLVAHADQLDAGANRSADALEEYYEALQLMAKLEFADPHALSELHHKIGFISLFIIKPALVDAALEAFREAVRLNPSKSDSRRCYACALFDHNQKEEAIEEFREAIDLDPLNHTAYSSLGACLINMDRFAEAIDNLREAVRLKPEYKELSDRMSLAHAFELNGQINEAIGEWETVANTKPSASSSYWNRKDREQIFLAFHSLAYYTQGWQKLSWKLRKYTSSVWLGF